MIPLSTLTLWLLLLLSLVTTSARCSLSNKDVTILDELVENIDECAKQCGRTVIDDELEGLRTLIVKGLPDFDIPVLDPLEVDRYDVSVHQEPSLVADVCLSNVRFEGFRDFVTKTLLPAPGVPVPPNPTIHFTTTVPVVNITGLYQAKGYSSFKGKNTTINGDGSFVFQVKNFVIDVKMDLEITFRLRKVRVHMSIGDVHVKAEGGSDVSELLNSEASYRFERWFVFAAHRLEEEAEQFLHYYVAKKVQKEPMWMVHKMETF